jgi:hypothetical protein
MKLRLLTAVGLALMVGALVLEHSPNVFETRVTEELMHAPSNHWPRPALEADGGTGHFGTVLESEWNVLVTLEDNWSAIPVQTRLDCVLATSDLDVERHFHPQCKQWLSSARKHLPVIERAVAAAEAGPADRFDPVRGPESGNASKLMVAGRIPALVTMMTEAEAITEEDHAKAVDACVLTLQVMRDFSWGMRSSELALGERIGTELFYPCAHALLRTTPERRARFEQQLAAIAAGRAPVVHNFTVTRASEVLHWYGPALPKKTLERADPKVAAWIARSGGSVAVKSLRKEWSGFIAYYDGLVDAAQQPPERRRIALNGQRDVFDDVVFRSHSYDFDASKSVDAVFEGLKVMADLADQSETAHGWPETLPRGEQIRLSRGKHGINVLLDLRTAPVAVGDGGVTQLPNEWLFVQPLDVSP